MSEDVEQSVSSPGEQRVDDLQSECLDKHKARADRVVGAKRILDSISSGLGRNRGCKACAAKRIAYRECPSQGLGVYPVAVVRGIINVYLVVLVWRAYRKCVHGYRIGFFRYRGLCNSERPLKGEDDIVLCSDRVWIP